MNYFVYWDHPGSKGWVAKKLHSQTVEYEAWFFVIFYPCLWTWHVHGAHIDSYTWITCEYYTMVILIT